MTERNASRLRVDLRSLLMIGVSLATLASGLAPTSAGATTAAARLAAQASGARPQTQSPTAVPQRSGTMRAAIARQRATQSRTEQIRAYVVAARDAALAANHSHVTDGLSTHGLDPTDAIREAIAAAQAGDTARVHQLLVSSSAANDATGLKTWEGAGLPTQSVVDGRVVVTIDQTQERALLSWNSFNIGANTTLQFNQKSNGTPQPGWVVANRVTNSVAPSSILGNLKADGTVVVVNQRGIIFGQNAQVNAHSLLASTLEIGTRARRVNPGSSDSVATTIKERNNAFLENGLFAEQADSVWTSHSLLVSSMSTGNGLQPGPELEGDIIVEQGARISAGAGGFLMLTAPKIESAGILSAVDGQVSLQAGRAISFRASTGADTSIDPYVRGYKLFSFDPTIGASGGTMRESGPDDGSIRITGLIESRRGYISLGTSAFGTIEHAGLLSTTTSVSRNGKISILAGNITFKGDADPTRAAGITMLPDDSGETIPQGSPHEPAKFKSSQLEIATAVPVHDNPAGYVSLATNFSMGENAVIFAPNADVKIGSTTIDPRFPGKIDIASGAIIDVSGLKDVQLDASRNTIEITPVKRNELRDTPNYREVAIDGNFTLNGATLYIDPRLSGVRDDGVAWIGSPLIEAGSLAAQIGFTAAEFMTKGGTVNLLAGAPNGYSTLDPHSAPRVNIAQGATIDFSGGWVNYAGGPVRTSRLITNDGRIVDISQANPNDVYVGVAEGFTEIQPRFGIVRTYFNATARGQRFEASYDEGRDAGLMRIDAPAVTIDGTFHGDAFAGSRQVVSGDRPSRTSPLTGDSRKLQRTPYELPSGGALSIESLGDILVYRGTRGTAATNPSELLLSDRMLSDAGLSALSLHASGAITFAGANPETLQTPDVISFTGASELKLAPGGTLSVMAGRTIRFDGTVEVPSGTIKAETNYAGPARPGQAVSNEAQNGSVFRDGLYGEGIGDDLPRDLLYAEDPGALNPFDIIVNGQLSAAGLWVNDFTETGVKRGGAFSDGGSISLTVAPKVFMAVGSSMALAERAVDLSGSIRIRGLLDVGAGGYVTPTGGLRLDGKGGDVALVNATVYASLSRTSSGLWTNNGFEFNPDLPIGGDNQSVDFTPVTSDNPSVRDIVPALVPDPRSTVEVAPGSLRGFGFDGGGTFTLVAPDISFGSDNRPGSTHIGLDFFQTTGFGALEIETIRSRIVPDLFTNERAGNSAFLETTRFVVGAGETLDLTQWLLPSILTAEQGQALRQLATGADLATQSILTPYRPDQAWDQRAARLTLLGLAELNVMEGGAILGAPEASITASKIYNAGRILLHGGQIRQSNALITQENSTLAARLYGEGLGVRGLAEAFGGPVDAAGRFDEDALNAAGITDVNGDRVLTNRELVSRDHADRLVHFLGLLDADEGIVLDAGSVTDLSGVALFDPRTPFKGNGMAVRSGRVLAGGTLATDAVQEGQYFYGATGRREYGFAPKLIRHDAAALDISGASGLFDQAAGAGTYVPYLEWSAAGTIAALGGGSLGNTPIKARGGVEAAEGGTLEWLRPTVGSADASDPDYLPAGMIADSGFDTLVVHGPLTLDGEFALTLRKALIVKSQDTDHMLRPENAANLSVAATEGTNAQLSASYIRFESRRGAVSGPFGDPTNARVAFTAGAQGIDFVGAISIDPSVGSVSFSTPGDVRLTGIKDLLLQSALDRYDGQLIAGGDMLIDARRVYATTGTGNLQALLEGASESAAPPYILAATGDHSITFGNSYLDPNAPAPLSAGTRLKVLAARIVQNGYLAAPLGQLELGSTEAYQIADGALTVLPTESLVFGAGSVTTVSGAGLDIPYGTTSDLIEYYYPTIDGQITKLPTGQLQLAGQSIDLGEGARVDGRGGGDLFAYEFQSGVGGSRDVLDRINRDPFSSNDYDPATGIGYQYPDHRQVFALVPVDAIGKIAPYDPIYSADYGAAGPVDLYGAKAGLTVTLESAPGIAGGEYLLLPAKYAMAIPGALRVVENVGADAPLPGTGQQLLDGSIIVAGRFGYGGTGISESTRRSFTVQSKDSFLKFSKIETTSGSKTISDRATKDGTARPRLPLDAARVILSPLEELRVAGVFDTTPAEGGEGGQFDILGNNIIIAAEGTEVDGTGLVLTDAALRNLNAASLLIGGQRRDGADGTTTIAATAHSIDVLGGATLQASEMLLAVGGAGSQITIADGAALIATGALGTQPEGDYAAASGGSLLRLANGAERLVSRTGSGQSTIEIGAATLSGSALALDSSGDFLVSETATLAAKQIALSGLALQIGGDGDTPEPGVISAGLAAKLGTAERLTLRSPGALRFAAGTYRFNDLVIDSATLATTPAVGAGEDVNIVARHLSLTNATKAADGCTAAGHCGQGSQLLLDTATISLGANDVRTAGFADGVTLAAREGIYVEGKGSFATGDSALTLQTPFLAERAPVADPREQKVRPDYSFLTNAGFTLVAPAGAGSPNPSGNAAPGARIGIGTADAPVLSATIVGGLIRATAGIIDIQAQTDISLSGATLATPGYEAVFGDKVDPVTVSASGGTINLLARNGSISADAASTLVSDSGVGKAGKLQLLASNGSITLDAALNPQAQGNRGGSFNFDSGTGSFDLGRFATEHTRLFGGDIWIRSGAGDLSLAAGQLLKAKNVTLTADGGAINIAGMIDTSGVNVSGMSADAARNADVGGGDIGLWGAAGVTLASTAVLDTHTTGYADSDSRVASAGDVYIGIERSDAAIRIEKGAVIDVGARRTQAAQAAGETGARLIPETITDPLTNLPQTVYRYAEADQGGTVHLRAPVIGMAGDQVAVSAHGTILGASDIQLEAFRRYDLDAMAQSGVYSGLSVAEDGTLLLNMAQSHDTTGKWNPFTEKFQLDDGTPSLVQFIQDFSVRAADGSSLAGMRLRPGVELVSKGDIKTETQWNLAAASFSQEQLDAAVAAGSLVLIEDLSTEGNKYYSVVPGREGDLLDRFTSFVYRVGGTARGEAPVVSLRAGGDLRIDRSITDGFFTFRDKSDPAYINYQLGGGGRTYSPAVRFACGSVGGYCGSIVGYEEGVRTNPGASGRVNITLNVTAEAGMPASGAAFVNSPLAVTGNGAAGAVDASGNPIGDPFRFAELFPLLPGDQVMHSSDLRLVGGAGTTLSVNPLHVNRSTDANVTVSGEYSYRVEVTDPASLDGPMQFIYHSASNRDRIIFGLDEAFNLSETQAGLDQLREDAYASVTWGTSRTGLGADARAFALDYFEGKGYGFTGSASAPTGIIAPLNEIVAFLKAFEPIYREGLVSGRPGYSFNTDAVYRDYGNGANAYVRSFVRTGDGDIRVAAARDIDLRGAPDPVYRQENGTSGSASNGRQFASAAIYTAGVRVAATNVSARIVGGDFVSIRPDSPYLQTTAERIDFIPSAKGLSDSAPVLARGGGDVLLEAGRDVLGRRDAWSEAYLSAGQSYNDCLTCRSTSAGFAIGDPSQRWRTGQIGDDTEIGISPQYFTSGAGALGGGDVSIRAGRDVTELTVALDSSVTTTLADAGKTLLTFGSGDLLLEAGRDILAGRFDIASGAASIYAERNIDAFGTEPGSGTNPQYAVLRLTDAMANVSARGAATLAGVSALSAGSIVKPGFFTPAAGFSLTAIEDVRIGDSDSAASGSVHDYGRTGWFPDEFGQPRELVHVRPPSMEMTSLSGSIILPEDAPQFLYPSPLGKLRLFSDGDMKLMAIVMSDADPVRLGSAFNSATTTYPFDIPYVSTNITDAMLRAQHNRRPTHAGNPDPVRIYSNGDISQTAFFLPKQARITAGGHIIDMFFNGQNLASSDITRIRAGGDIRGTVGTWGGLPFVRSNNFILGGPGTFMVEAGRDLGPFVTSASVNGIDGNTYHFAGGIRTIGNDYNPWLPAEGADLSVRFGMAAGADYAALRETYLNPVNSAKLDGDLFVQVEDAFGNSMPDRSKPIYAPMLAAWLRDNEPALFRALFEGQSFPDTEAGNAALAEAAYGRYDALYQAFAGLELLRQQDFLINRLYFNELAETANPDGPSYLQYIRGYRAVQTLFPASLGYTDNLAPYTLDPATVSEDHPLGEPVRQIVDGQPQRAERVVTGSIDLRLATIQTGRGGDVTILGPGGDVIAGSVVRTSEQVARRMTAFRPYREDAPPYLESGSVNRYWPSAIAAIPLGYEGVLTLQSGQIRSFTDGSFILNQSRVFAQQGGDITMWSSNGDLNAGQGPKSASNFPPITVRFDQNGLAEVDSAGSVSGAGIGTFKRRPEDEPSSVFLIAPVGEVDAGDAGVRASGNVVVAAARVANADNFSAAGEITGVPTSAVTATPVTPAEAASAVAAQAAGAATAANNQGDRRSQITVEVLGPVESDGQCAPGDASCS